MGRTPQPRVTPLPKVAACIVRVLAATHPPCTLTHVVTPYTQDASQVASEEASQQEERAPLQGDRSSANWGEGGTVRSVSGHAL